MQAGGNVGKFITEALLKTGKHTITAITRADSESKLPEGVIVKKVDYNKPDTLVEAFRGQDALIITLSGGAPQGTEVALINAAGEACVPWILPSDFTPDTANEALAKDVFVFQARVAIRKAIEDLGKSSYISVVTGFWYEYCLAMPAAFGFDFAKQAVTFFDEGDTKVSLSTWPLIGRAVAALLSLPIEAQEGADKGACLEDFRNKCVYINSFTVSQKDMLQSTLRVTGTKEEDWTITKEPVQERIAMGKKESQEGKRSGFARVMFTRIFFPDGCGDYEASKGTLNSPLGLPKDDIDEATKVAIERSKLPQRTNH